MFLLYLHDNIKAKKKFLFRDSVDESTCLWSKAYLFYLEQAQQSEMNSAWMLSAWLSKSMPYLEFLTFWPTTFFFLPGILFVFIQQQKLVLNNSLTRLCACTFSLQLYLLKTKLFKWALIKTHHSAHCVSKSTRIPSAGNGSSGAPDRSSGHFSGRAGWIHWDVALMPHWADLRFTWVPWVLGRNVGPSVPVEPLLEADGGAP